MDALSPRLARLRDAGYKLTNARMCVIRVLESHDGHMTSADILAEVARLDATIGRASVFRTLDLLTHLAMIRPTYIDSSATPTYVLMPDGHHHHIICVQCSRVIEFEECGLAALTQRLEAEYGVRVSGHLLEFYATCADCIAQPRPAEETD